MKVRLSRAAHLELREAFDYYEQEQSGLGQRFLDDVEHARQRILQQPLGWHPLSPVFRRCRLRHFPYGLIYRVLGEVIEIIAVAHLHRAPEYWRDRLKNED